MTILVTLILSLLLSLFPGYQVEAGNVETLTYHEEIDAMVTEIELRNGETIQAVDYAAPRDSTCIVVSHSQEVLYLIDICQR